MGRDLSALLIPAEGLGKGTRAGWDRRAGAERLPRPFRRQQEAGRERAGEPGMVGNHRGAPMDLPRDGRGPLDPGRVSPRPLCSPSRYLSMPPCRTLGCLAPKWN